MYNIKKVLQYCTIFTMCYNIVQCVQYFEMYDIYNVLQYFAMFKIFYNIYNI
jgi:hypothetical protein